MPQIILVGLGLSIPIGSSLVHVGYILMGKKSPLLVDTNYPPVFHERVAPLKERGLV